MPGGASLTRAYKPTPCLP